MDYNPWEDDDKRGELYADQGPPTAANDQAELAEFRLRDAGGNIIDGAYADGKTKISSVSREGDRSNRYRHGSQLWREANALIGLERIRKWIDVDQSVSARLKVYGMVRTLIRELEL